LPALLDWQAAARMRLAHKAFLAWQQGPRKALIRFQVPFTIIERAAALTAAALSPAALAAAFLAAPSISAAALAAWLRQMWIAVGGSGLILTALEMN